MIFDPYWSNVTLNMRMEGADNSTAFIDDKGHIVTAFGNAKLSTTAPLSGASSGIFDGSGDYLQIISPPADIIDWYSTDYTLEFLVKYSTFAGIVNPQFLLGNADNVGTNYWAIGAKSTGVLSFYYWNGSANYVDTIATIPLNTTTHIELSVSGTTIRLFIGGVLSATATIGGTPQSSSSIPFQIGRIFNTSFSGKVDNVRITKGIARHTTNFTPPTEIGDGVATSGTLLVTESADIFAATATLTSFVTGTLIINEVADTFMGVGLVATSGNIGTLSAIEASDSFYGTTKSTLELPYQNKLSGNYSKKVSFKNVASMSHNQYLRKMGMCLACVNVEYSLKYIGLTNVELAEIEALLGSHDVDTFVSWKAPIDFNSMNFKKPKSWAKEIYFQLGNSVESGKEPKTNLSFTITSATRGIANSIPTPIYIITPNATSISEGDSVTFTITTSHVPDGTTLYYTVLNGTTSSVDLSPVSGSITIAFGGATFSITTSSDGVPEGIETFSVQLRTYSLTGTVVATSSTITIAHSYPTSSTYYKYFKLVDFLGTNAAARLLYYMRSWGYTITVGFTPDGIDVPSDASPAPTIVYYRLLFTDINKTYIGSVGSLGGVGSTSGSFFDMGTSNIIDKAQAVSTLTEQFQLTTITDPSGSTYWSPLVFDSF